MPIDPWAAQIARLQAEQEALDRAPLAPMYSPEEVEKRRKSNRFDEQWGALGTAATDDQMNKLGATYLKKALEERATKETEKGVLDPIDGTMTYFPGYLQKQKSDRLGKSLDRAYEGQAKAIQDENENRQRAADRLALKQGLGGALGSMGGTAQEVGKNAAGSSVFRHKDTGNLFSYDDKGQVTPHAGKLYSKEAVPAQTQREISDKEAYLEDAMNFGATYKPEFAGTAPIIGQIEAFTGRYTGGKAEPMANWWQNYRNWVINLRRDLFGTALTAPEKASFDQANIEPGMKTSIIEQRLKQQQAAVARAVNKYKAPYANRPGMDPVNVPQAPAPGTTPPSSMGVWNSEGPLAQSLGLGRPQQAPGPTYLPQAAAQATGQPPALRPQTPTVPQPGGYADPGKEARYQEWLRSQGR